MSEPLLRPAGLLDDEMGLHLLVLAPLLLRELGPAYLTWDSVALYQELSEKFGHIGLITWERIEALRVLHVHDAFWKEWEVFEKVTAAICGELPIFSLAQPPEAEEIALALETARQIDVHDYDEDVKGYIVASCLTDGLWYFEGLLEDVGGPVLRVYDQKEKISREFAEVAGELQKSDKFRDPAEDVVSNQVNRVLEVRLVLSRYREVVEAQRERLHLGQVTG